MYGVRMFELLEETEHNDSCTWQLQVVLADGKLSHHRVRLSWADYDLFAPDGTTPPANVAEAVVAFMLEQAIFTPLPPLIDAAIPRRCVSGADEQIAARINRQ